MPPPATARDESSWAVIAGATSRQNERARVEAWTKFICLSYVGRHARRPSRCQFRPVEAGGDEGVSGVEGAFRSSSARVSNALSAGKGSCRASSKVFFTPSQKFLVNTSFIFCQYGSSFRSGLIACKPSHPSSRTGRVPEHSHRATDRRTLQSRPHTCRV
jgi:hypothetical protein